MQSWLPPPHSVVATQEELSSSSSSKFPLNKCLQTWPPLCSPSPQAPSNNSNSIHSPRCPCTLLPPLGAVALSHPLHSLRLHCGITRNNGFLEEDVVDPLPLLLLQSFHRLLDDGWGDLRVQPRSKWCHTLSIRILSLDRWARVSDDPGLGSRFPPKRFLSSNSEPCIRVAATAPPAASAARTSESPQHVHPARLTSQGTMPPPLLPVRRRVQTRQGVSPRPRPLSRHGLVMQQVESARAPVVK